MATGRPGNKTTGSKSSRSTASGTSSKGGQRTRPSQGSQRGASTKGAKGSKGGAKGVQLTRSSQQVGVSAAGGAKKATPRSRSGARLTGSGRLSGLGRSGAGGGKASALTLSVGQARAVCLVAQGLAPGLASQGTLLARLERTGFLRTLGGIDVYLAARARWPGLRRADLDGLVASGQAQVIPAVRGCIYLVAGRYAPLALRIAESQARPRMDREHQKAGISERELAELGQGVVEILRKAGPLSTEGLRRALPAGSVRSLGEAGKKMGLSSTLPPALRLLEFAGRVERLLDGGRLDSERYLWRLAPISPFERFPVPEAPEDRLARLAELFFRSAGVSTMSVFAEWAGLAQRDARAAMEQAGLLTVSVEGLAEQAFALEEQRGWLASALAPADTAALLPFEDNLIALHGGPALLVDRIHHRVEVPEWGNGDRSGPLGEAHHMFFRSIVAEGQIVGFWEYDPDTRALAVTLLGQPSAPLVTTVRAAAADTARFIAEELGHGRSFSLDTDDALRERAALLRRGLRAI